MDFFKIFRPHEPQSHEDVYGSMNDALKKARHLVNNRMKPFDADGIGAKSDKHVQLVVIGTDPLSLAIAFHAMQMCHFPNFNDKKPANRTKISFIVPGMLSLEQIGEVRDLLAANFGCLLDSCVWSMRVDGADIALGSSPEKCFIDIEIEVIGIPSGDVSRHLSQFEPDKNAVVSLVAPAALLHEDIAAQLSGRYWQICLTDDERIPDSDLEVDIRRARLVNLIYEQSQHLQSITPNHIYEIQEYAAALDIVASDFSSSKVHKKWQELGAEYKLSNIYCADCFEYRLRSLHLTEDSQKNMLVEAVKKNIADLARTEHARWNVERLLLGFRPLNADERHRYGTLSGQALRDYRDELKVRKAHVDICSYTDLMRIDMDSIKYDIFLMLTIPAIIVRCPEK